MKYVGISVGIVLALTLFLGWMGKPAPAPRAARKPPIVTRVHSQVYQLGAGERMTLIDIPDLYVPRRCALFTNDATGHQLLSCNFDAAGSPFPEANEGD